MDYEDMGLIELASKLKKCTNVNTFKFIMHMYLKREYVLDFDLTSRVYDEYQKFFNNLDDELLNTLIDDVRKCQIVASVQDEVKVVVDTVNLFNHTYVEARHLYKYLQDGQFRQIFKIGGVGDAIEFNDKLILDLLEPSKHQDLQQLFKTLKVGDEFTIYRKFRSCAVLVRLTYNGATLFQVGNLSFNGNVNYL